MHRTASEAAMRHRSLLLFAAAFLAACGDPTPKMHVERSTVFTGEDIVVVFDEGLQGRATNQYWVSLVPADAPLDDVRGRTVLERTERVVRLHASAPGELEVRLHGRYAEKEHHLLVRIPVSVRGWPVKSATWTP
jgi:hypothetical protein